MWFQRRTLLTAAALLAMGTLTGRVRAQGQPASSQVIGEVAAIEAQSRQVSLKSDKGEMITVALSETASVRKVPPGAQDLTRAARIPFSEIAKGDRIAAIGQRSEDQKRVDARTVVVMARSELNQKQAQEQADWQKRGVAGIVSATDPGTQTFAIKSAQNTLQVQSGEKTDYRRYAPDSVKFSDALPSSLAEIKVGDQMRVLGDKSADGASIKAERIVFGSFRQVAATISSLNAENHEITIKDLAAKKTLVVRVNAESVMRKLPPAMAAGLARRYGPGGRSAPGAPAAPSGGRGGTDAGGDIGQMLDRLPAMPFADLKPGDAIMLSCTAGSDPAKVTAVMLLAGVEALLTAPNATRDILSGWNMGGVGGDSQ
jgi:hypothetical protein